MKNKIKQPTKSTKNRITVLILALLLTATVLIPQIPVKAEETTTESSDISENNSSGTSAGAGDVLPVDSNVHLKTEFSYTSGKTFVNFACDYYLMGNGHFNVRTAKIGKSSLSGYYSLYIYIFSDKQFTLSSYSPVQKNTVNGETTTYTNFTLLQEWISVPDCYCLCLSFGTWGTSDCTDFSLNSPNIMNFTDEVDFDAIKATIDLTKDDYKDADTNPDSYVRDKSLGYLQGVRYYEVKNTGNERDAVISWNASNPELNDCQIEIRANNFYVEWWNKKTSEICSYKKYGDGISYKDGKYTFKTLEPCRFWLSDKNIDVSIKTQSYGTTEYYVRLLRLDKENNVVKCGGWVKIDINRGTSTKLPDSTSDTGDWDDDTGDWKDDDDSDDSYHDHVGDDGEVYYPPEVDFNSIVSILESLSSAGMGFLGLFTTVFGFLPSWLTTLIFSSFAIACFLGLWKIIRG